MKVLFTGSFDPLTMGHMDIIQRSSALFSELTVGIIVNPNKKSLFTEAERKDMITHLVSHLPNVKVDMFSGLLADYVNKMGFQAVIRGIRDNKDLVYESQMAAMNKRLFQNQVETIFLLTDPSYGFLSSSMVKEVASLGGSIEGLVPEAIIETIEAKYR